MTDSDDMNPVEYKLNCGHFINIPSIANVWAIDCSECGKTHYPNTYITMDGESFYG